MNHCHYRYPLYKTRGQLSLWPFCKDFSCWATNHLLHWV